MEIPGRIHNGVVVFDEPGALPESAYVTVGLQGEPPIEKVGKRYRLKFPLVRSESPGAIRVSNEMIGEILDAEDASA